MDMNFDESTIKADPLGGIIPQEIISGDLLRGYGPRRGNLERLLRYWRPIMRKPGGFRRCRVILADHPELYPLNNICAWLHHETTGLWPNEGCHHPTMKNCRGKLRKENWTNMEFASQLSRAAKRTVKKSLSDSLNEEDVFFHEFKSADANKPKDVVTESDVLHAFSVLRDFIEMEPKFAEFLRDENNWEMEGENEDGETVKYSIPAERKSAECCGGEYE
jgi:hypothetical protein